MDEELDARLRGIHADLKRLYETVCEASPRAYGVTENVRWICNLDALHLILLALILWRVW